MKTSAAKRDADEPLELGRVRRRLHRAAAVAGVEHLAEGALEVDRLRRRARDGAPLAADPALDGAEEPGPAAGRGEDRVEEERGRRLPVRARDAGDLELARRPAEERVGRERHRRAGVGDDELGHRQVERRARRRARRRPALDGVGGEVVAVGALRRGRRRRALPAPTRRASYARSVTSARGGVERARRADGLAQGLELDGGLILARVTASFGARCASSSSCPACILARSVHHTRRFSWLSRARASNLERGATASSPSLAPARPAAPRGTGARTRRSRRTPARRRRRPRSRLSARRR